jgi:hypothetical protein
MDLDRFSMASMKDLGGLPCCLHKENCDCVPNSDMMSHFFEKNFITMISYPLELIFLSILPHPA